MTKKKEKIVVSYNSSLDENKDTIKLTVTYNTALQKLLKKVAVSGVREFKYNVGHDNDGNKKMVSLERTKVKTAIWNGFKSKGRDLLFVKELIFNKKFDFEFYDISKMESTITMFSNNVGRAIELINEYSNIKHKVSFNVEKD